MKNQRVYQDNGMEATTVGLAVTAEQGGSLMDQMLAELFRLQPKGASVAKGIVPYGIFKTNGTDPQSAGVVASTGAADGTIAIYPFRAIVAPFAGSDGQELAWTRHRTVTVVSNNGTALQNIIGLSPTDGTHRRCDLIYCKITLAGEQTSESRYLRDPITGVVSITPLLIQLSDTFELNVVEGAPTTGTNPARPSLPADTATEIYIPLAYVFLPLSFGATVVNNARIHEVAPVLPMSRATGVSTMCPASALYNKDGDWLTQIDFNTTTRPAAYLPPTMTGAETRIVAFDWILGHTAPALNGNRIVDDSVDWRNRVFRWTATADNLGSFAWAGGKVPQAGDTSTTVETGIGQSFTDDGTVSISQAGGVVAKNIGGGVLSGVIDHPISLFVDLSTGALKCKVPSSSPDAVVFVWVEASGQFANAS